jgi:hypothetical protein
MFAPREVSGVADDHILFFTVQVSDEVNTSLRWLNRAERKPGLAFRVISRIWRTLSFSSARSAHPRFETGAR